VKRIVIVAFDGAQALDVVGPFEVFAGAAQARPEAYRVEIAAMRRGAVKTSSGIALTPHRALRDLRTVDTLIVAGGPGARAAAKDAAMVATVARIARRARRVASVCTGTFVLAAAGLLDGKRATTHWAHCARLAAAHPEIQVEPDPIFVRDGRIWTSAGVTAGMDLALALVEDDLGRDLALTIARHLVMFVRRAGGQSQFSAQLAVQAAERAPIRELQAWITDHPDGALDVPSLAGRAGMSVRHFTRVFRDQVATTPAAYVERVRVETARRLLETTARSIEDVAGAAGFGTPEALRRSFARGVGLSPREYRARFGASQRGPSP